MNLRSGFQMGLHGGVLVILQRFIWTSLVVYIVTILKHCNKTAYIQMCFISHFNLSKNISIVKYAAQLTYLEWTSE